MGVFDVESQEFSDRVSFNQYLAENYSADDEGNLYIIAGMTEYTRSGFLDLLSGSGYETLEEYGAILKMRKDYGKDQYIEFYLSYDVDDQIVLFYTDMRKTEEIENTIEPFLEATPGVHYLYLSPRILQGIRDEIEETEPTAEITEFVAKRTEHSESPSRFRPEAGRTIHYFGDDGMETLREMEHLYGVLPRILEFRIPQGLKFRVNHEGIFNLKRGSLMALFEHVQTCIEECLEVKRAYEGADFKMVPASDSLSIPTSEPASITLHNRLKYHEVDDFVNSMQDSDYVLLDTFAEEGSLYFSSKVIDQQKKSSFRLKANEGEIRVYPDEKRDLASFFRFYEFIQDNLDENAEVVTA